jgi:hypothetical protein
VGTPDNLPPATPADKTPDVLIWPPPADELEILWLDDEKPRVIAAAPQTDLSIPFTRLRAPSVALEWHEAVALMQQLVDQVAPDRVRLPPGSVPPVDAIRLEPSGRLRVRLDPPGEPFIRGLGKLLTELLQSNPAPANLRLLAWQAASESAAPLRLDEIGRQLAGWERPGRPAALAALYARALAIADAPSDAAAAPVPVRRVDAPAPAPVPPREDPPAPAARYSARTIAIVSAALSAAVMIVGFAVYANLRGAAPVAVQPAVATASAAAPAATQEPAAAPAVADSAPRAAGGDIELAPQKPRGRRTRGAAASRRTSDSGVLILNDVAAHPAPDRRVNVPPPSADAIQTVPLELFAARAASPEPAIYTSDDASIVEPVLVHPYLPFRAHPGTPPDKLGVLELVVDTHGAVESVHLNSPDNRYRERWWMFSAKTWRFRPATKNGRAVRFLKRIPLTDLNLLEPQ